MSTCPIRAVPIIEPETEINYRIRFQNTGTDTAFTVVVRDTLDAWLDLTTFRRGVSSHPYTLDVAGQRTLTFTFENILLPDSTTNLEGSQGFLDFSLRPRQDIPLGTVVENSAAIYFDFNEPVITNTWFHTVDRNFLEIIDWIAELPGLELRWRLFPNPAREQVQVELAGANLPGVLTLVLSDNYGRPVLQQPMKDQLVTLSLDDLPTGWYILQLRDEQGRLLGTAKLVKR